MLTPLFGKAPSHAVVVSTSLADGWRYRFVTAMLELNEPENVQMLLNMYGSPALVPTNNLHLADLAKALEQLPWLENTILGNP
jgi:phosphonate transport system substrate-binding protein